MYREIHSVGSEYLVARSLATVTAGFFLIALPTVAGGMPLQGFYELIVFAGMCAALFFQIKRSRAVYIYQFIGDELVVRRQTGGRVKVCAHVKIGETAAFTPYGETSFSSRRKYAPKNFCGHIPGKKDYYLLKKGKLGKQAIIFEPSPHLISIINARLKEKEPRQ